MGYPDPAHQPEPTPVAEDHAPVDVSDAAAGQDQFAAGGVVSEPVQLPAEQPAPMYSPQDTGVTNASPTAEAPQVANPPNVTEAAQPENTTPAPSPEPSTEPVAEVGTFQGASNESPVLTPGAQAAAARAHHFFTHIANLAHQAQADIEKYVPASIVRTAENEALAFIRSIL